MLNNVQWPLLHHPDMIQESEQLSLKACPQSPRPQRSKSKKPSVMPVVEGSQPRAAPGKYVFEAESVDGGSMVMHESSQPHG